MRGRGGRDMTLTTTSRNAQLYNDVLSLTELGREYLARHVALTHYEDVKFPATAINPPGLVSDPDFDTDEGGYLFDDSSTELLFIIGQLPHSYPEGAMVSPHVHWEQAAAGNVVWQLEYKWYNNGDAVPAEFTPIESQGVAFAYSSGTIGQISIFPPIDGTGKKISSILRMKLSRLGGDTGDDYTGDALMTEFDLHCACDGHGSEYEYGKEQ